MAELDSTFKTIGEVAEFLQLPAHVLRFWEEQFSIVKPLKRRGNRRFYSPKDIETLERIKTLLYVKGYTIKGARKALNQSFIPVDDLEMARKKDNVKNYSQIDIFEMIGGEPANPIFPEPERPIVKNPRGITAPSEHKKEALNKILDNLREIETLLLVSASS